MVQTVKGPEIKDAGKITVIASGNLSVSSTDPRIVVIKKQ